MPIFNPDKVLRDLPKTPIILNVVLRGVDQARAKSATDGADGWSVLEVVCHIHDFEQIFFDRAREIVESDRPQFGILDYAAWVVEHHYAEQNLADVFASYVSRRRAFLAYLRTLTPDQWARTGVHYSWGEMSVVDLATNTTLHDVNHIEQIIKALGTSSDLAAL